MVQSFRMDQYFIKGVVMDEWKERLQLRHITIETCVGDYLIKDFTNKIPNGSFGIKIYSCDNKYEGITSIRIVDLMGEYYCASGYGETEYEALYNTIEVAYKEIEKLSTITDDSFLPMDIDMY